MAADGMRPEDTLAAGWVTGAILSHGEAELIGDVDGRVDPVSVLFDVKGIGRLRVDVRAVLAGDEGAAT